ncbi:MAG TPA: 3-hydroxyacyl-CoA dehydrogenase NAD-binding domain-containing protein [Candidatus Limnocylindrales bacterium]|nr:3-hydroxyacyl-CoA dehydrogenase NAD-binding domain-containing protein [Candidatus Limnocylindrales bacterium]
MTIVGIVGAGVMGAGIAQVALEAGWEVVLHDVDPDAIERARDSVRQGLARRAARLDLDDDSIEAWVDGRAAGLRHAHVLDGLATEASLIIEAALEDLYLKRTIFRALGAEASPEVILASNTSALSISEIAKATDRPDRVLGLHFFNPVPLMALVEVVPGSSTAPETVERAEDVVRAWGKTPVRSADRPGFIVNRVNRPYTIEALRMVEDGVADVVGIDDAMRQAGFPLGPFELMDLSGLDVNLAAARGVWSGLGEPARLQPSRIQERLVATGRLGRKSGAGFYRYADGRRGEVDPEFARRPGRPLGADKIRARIEAAIVEEARFAIDDGVASPDDVVTALRLGAGHPDRFLATL